MNYLKNVSPSNEPILSAARQSTAAIVQAVRQRGWSAVQEFSARYDGFSGPFRIPRERAVEALSAMSPHVRTALETAVNNVRTFHRLQRDLFRNCTWEIAPGVSAGLRFLPVENVAVYVPGGRYPLPSTAVMGIVAAQEAGVSRIAVLSPPRGPEGIHPVVLGTLGLLGIEEIWALGGAQGVAALALGTSPVAKVDMIVGPGNVYVTEAKRLLFGEVGIDGLAGPSEVLVVADETASPDLIAADLLAQAEHDPLARSILLTLDEKTALASLAATERLLGELPEENARIARESWSTGGVVAVCTLEEAAAFANRLAPEHLELALADPESALPLFTAYGAVFLGHFSAEAFGDYVAGTNHILPTEGRARFGGGLWTGTFLRPLQQLRLSREGAEALAEAGNALATAEGLAAHALAMTKRGIPS